MSGLIRDYPGGSAQLHRLILDRDDEQDGDDHNGDDHDVVEGLHMIVQGLSKVYEGNGEG